VIWPDAPATRDRAIAYRRAYERLKLVMDDQRKFADEHFFLRKELECREAEEPGTLRTVASRIFGLLSGYGWSIERPVLALGIAWVVGWAVIGLAEWADACLGYDQFDCMSNPAPAFPEKALGFFQSGFLSFSNLFAFLGLGWHIMKDELSSLTAASEIVAAAQMFAGPVLLFLLALALRNRFRIK
jgi:hypothetical protein